MSLYLLEHLLPTDRVYEKPGGHGNEVYNEGRGNIPAIGASCHNVGI